MNNEDKIVTTITTVSVTENTAIGQCPFSQLNVLHHVHHGT